MNGENPKLMIKNEMQKELEKLKASDSEVKEILKRLGYI